MKTVDKNNKVVVEDFTVNGVCRFNVYNEAGQCLAEDFMTFEKAVIWSNENGYYVVDSFFI